MTGWLVQIRLVVFLMATTDFANEYGGIFSAAILPFMTVYLILDWRSDDGAF